MRVYKEPVILNAKGEKIVLTRDERHNAEYWQKEISARFPALKNALGYEVPITTLTTIVKKVSEQKLYTVPFAKYLPVPVGNGTWSSNLTTFRTFDVADEFETGIVNTASDNARLASVDAAIDAVNVKIINWTKSYGYSVFALQEAAKSGNWDLVSAKEKTRLRNWQLGIQRIVFLGAKGLNGSSGACLGLLNQPNVTFNTTLITQTISSMTPTQLSTFQQTVLVAYRKNCQYTAMPNRFIVPESDFNAMSAQASPTYPLKTIMQVLMDAFKATTMRDDFQILPLSYADIANAGGALPAAATTCMYALYNYDEESIRADIPLDYTPTMANTIEGMNFQSAAYGQFTGAVAYRPVELLYMGF